MPPSGCTVPGVQFQGPLFGDIEGFLDFFNTVGVLLDQIAQLQAAKRQMAGFVLSAEMKNDLFGLILRNRLANAKSDAKDLPAVCDASAYDNASPPLTPRCRACTVIVPCLIENNTICFMVYHTKLVEDYPRTPWAFRGRAWITLVNQTLTLEAACDQLQATLRVQMTTIRNLEGRLKRSRDINLRIDQKERELLR